MDMSNQKILNKIKNLSIQEQKDLSYEELLDIINGLSPDEIIELSNIIDIQCLQDFVWVL